MKHRIRKDDKCLLKVFSHLVPINNGLSSSLLILLFQPTDPKTDFFIGSLGPVIRTILSFDDHVSKSHVRPMKGKSNCSWQWHRVAHGLIQMQIWLLFSFPTCFWVEPLEHIFLNWLHLAKARWPPWSFSSTRVGTATPTTIESSYGRIFSRFWPFFAGFKARQLSLGSCRISSSQESVLDHLKKVS